MNATPCMLSFFSPIENAYAIWTNTVIFIKYQICLQFILRTEKQMSPERNLQWFIKRLTRPNEDNKKDQICYNTWPIICIKNVLCTC